MGSAFAEVVFWARTAYLKTKWPADMYQQMIKMIPGSPSQL